MAKKKYDPLWEVIDEKNALQGQVPDVDAHCPHCNVKLHLGAEPVTGVRVTCGLCGGVSVITRAGGDFVLEALAPVQPPA